MRIAVIADLHSNLEATTAVKDDINTRKVDLTVCLGDVVGYNANPNEVVDFVRKYNIPTIQGNHDAVSCDLEDPWFFNEDAKRAAEWQAEQLHNDHKIWLAKLPEERRINDVYLGVHGAPGNRDEYISDWKLASLYFGHLGNGTLACFFGHTHKPSYFAQNGNIHSLIGPQLHNSNGTPVVVTLEKGNHYFINPGAVGQPRDGDPRAAYGILDTDRPTFEFRRVPYDLAKTQRKITEAGLPPELARRLAIGK